jgi:beta-glucosidase
VKATGKPVIVMISAGRPLVFTWVSEHVPAILYTWWLGTKAGDAMADVLFGDYNPSGRLPMTFPRTEGQIPIYYNYYNTGRPARNENDLNYVSAYIDLPNSPLYCFGFGLSYSKFEYGDIRLSSAQLKSADILKASISLTNNGRYNGRETIQLYIRDLVGSVVRPVKELKGFQQVDLEAGETKTITFSISTADLKFYNNQLKYDWEAGEFEIMLGPNSRDLKTARVRWGK